MKVSNNLKEVAKHPFRLDGWQNLLSGLGITNRDKIKATTYRYDLILSERELTDLYRGEGFAKRVVDLPVREMTRKGFIIEGDTDGKVLKEFRRLNGNVHFRNLLSWSKVYGGALMVLIIDYGKELEDELNINDMKSIEMIKVSIITKT